MVNGTSKPGFGISHCFPGHSTAVFLLSVSMLCSLFICVNNPLFRKKKTERGAPLMRAHCILILYF